MGGKEVMNREILCSEKEGRGTKATRKSSHTMRKSWQYLAVILILSCKGYEVSGVYFKKKGMYQKQKAKDLA